MADNGFDTSAMILNWVYFFALFGGAMAAGIRFGRLAVQHDKSRFLFAAIGFVGYLSVLKILASIAQPFNLAPGWFLAFSFLLAAALLTIVGYRMLKRSWEKSRN
jgi:peptidoglycan/LPS O-acetylase OafA/YrhL